MDAGLHYRRSRARLTELLAAVTPEEWDVEVPACPGWRVRDVLADLLGNVEDAIAGRLTGPPAEAQTAAQVLRHLEDRPAVLLASWNEAAPLFEAAITEMGALPAAIDALTHEHDVRHALGRPGGRDDELIPVLGELLLGRLDERVHLTADLDGTRHEGAGGGPPLALRASSFEVLRAAMGRRTLEQVRALDRSGDPDAVLDRFFVFGPATAPIVE